MYIQQRAINVDDDGVILKFLILLGPRSFARLNSLFYLAKKVLPFFIREKYLLLCRSPKEIHFRNALQKCTSEKLCRNALY
jgi:hypothetical protein